jgi:hypothetical protein
MQFVVDTTTQAAPDPIPHGVVPRDQTVMAPTISAIDHDVIELQISSL